MSAQATIQARIEAQQDLDTLVYGIRSIEVSRSAWGSCAAHSTQISAAIQVASDLLGQYVGQDSATLMFLKRAKKLAVEQLTEAKAAVKAIGTVRQLRLALDAAPAIESVSRSQWTAGDWAGLDRFMAECWDARVAA